MHWPLPARIRVAAGAAAPAAAVSRSCRRRSRTAVPISTDHDARQAVPVTGLSAASGRGAAEQARATSQRPGHGPVPNGPESAL